MAKILLTGLVIFSHLTYGQGWEYHVIDNSSSGADGVKLADINNDGLMDIATGWEEGGVTKLYIHPGKDLVRGVWPSVIVGHTPDVEDAVFADINGDGIQDIVSCTEGNTKKIFVHLAPSKDHLHSEKWEQKSLPAADGLMMWMYAEPLQLDGQFGIDLIAVGKGANAQLGWFEAPEDGSNLKAWQWHSISAVGWIMSVLLRDMDGDGDQDILVTDRRGALQSCRWLENPGVLEAQGKQWQSHSIGANGLEVMFMDVHDMNGDGIDEVVLTERTNQTIRIYQRRSGSGTKWEEQVIQIPATTGNGKSVGVGDVNGDGVVDIVLSTNTDKEEKVGLTWVDGRSIDTGKPLVFQPISGVHRSKFDKVELMDIDNDGDLDVLICEENYGENSEGLGVVWYENPFMR